MLFIYIDFSIHSVASSQLPLNRQVFNNKKKRGKSAATAIESNLNKPHIPSALLSYDSALYNKTI